MCVDWDRVVRGVSQAPVTADNRPTREVSRGAHRPPDERMHTLSRHEEENYAVFLSTLTKEQLILLAIHERNILINAYSRFERLRLSVRYGDEGSAMKVVDSIQRDDDAHNIGWYPEDIDYDRFIRDLRDQGLEI